MDRVSSPRLRGNAAALIADRYGLGAAASLVGPVDRGELAEVWRLATEQGQFAVKLPFAPVDPAELVEPAAFANAVAAAGVTTPRFWAADADLVTEVHGQQVVVLDWLDLAPPDRAVPADEVGALVAALHRVPFEGTRPSNRWSSEPVGADRWDNLVAQAREAGAPFAEDFAAYRDELVALEEWLDPLPADRSCHLDLWADNVRATADGGLCVFDWDNCGRGNQSEELGMVLFEFGVESAQRYQAVYESYVGSDGPGRVSEPRHFTTLIAQAGHLGEYQLGCWHAAAPGSPGRERATAAVEEFLGVPPYPRIDRDVLTAILDAIG